MSDLRIGDTVRVSNSATLAGTVGQIVPAGPHQFEDEVTVRVGSKLLYFRPVNLELVHEVSAAPVEGFSAPPDETVPASARHTNSARFHELLAEAGETHDRKQADYGKGDDPFANVRSSEQWGVDGWVGAMVRLNDKVNRLQALRTKGHLVNEAAKDSFMDIAVYSLIAFVLYEQSEKADA
jgi:hypothetical protein